ncbi:hypothetical protein [Acidithiobacillus ferrivorans]|uniref:hypothetical protein n=1 Tax=Acidithiobacillus ferrivorans TaxID=160808 RepID=UPI001C0687F6|nr:hypothetical protein [Acidithiobacillus ferrivorans]MBU2851652.1 hypothetical protein [Acidithiobacillus ferrivorans]
MTNNLALRNSFYLIGSIINKYGGAIVTIFSVLIALVSWLYPKGNINIHYVFIISFFSLSIIYILGKSLFLSIRDKSEVPTVRNISTQANGEATEIDVRFFLEPSTVFKRGLLVSIYYKDDSNDMELFIGVGVVEAITEKNIVQVLLRKQSSKLSPEQYLKIITPSAYCLTKYIVKPFLFTD